MSQRERAVYVSPGDGDFCPQRPARADPARADRKDPHARGRDCSAVQDCAQRQMRGASDLCRHCAARRAGLNLNGPQCAVACPRGYEHSMIISASRQLMIMSRDRQSCLELGNLGNLAT